MDVNRRGSSTPKLLMYQRSYSVSNGNMITNDQDRLNDIKSKAMEQMDRMVEQTKKIQELEDENFVVREENETLRSELEKMRQDIRRYEMLTNELERELEEKKQQVMEEKMLREDRRIDEISKSIFNQEYKKEAPEDIVKEWRNKYEVVDMENKVLREKLIDQNDMLKQNRSHIFELREEIEEGKQMLHTYKEELRKLESRDQVVITENRSKTELLGIIREKIEEKLKWESYAEMLVKLIIDNCPELLEITDQNVHKSDSTFIMCPVVQDDKYLC